MDVGTDASDAVDVVRRAGDREGAVSVVDGWFCVGVGGVEIVMPRAFSSGALSIWSYAVNVAPPVSARTLVIAAVSDVLPWST